ncbi:MAG: glycosyltransferase family 4 protein, partial [Actinomycetota bacterium]
MRVLQVVKGLDLGGAERVVTDLAVHLAARGPEVEVAVINGRRRALLPVLQQAGIAVHALPGTDLVGPRGVLALRRLIRSGNYDLVHAHGPVPLVLCRPFSPVPVVGTMHSVWGGLRRPSRWAAALLCGRVPLVAVAEAVRSRLPQRLARNTTVIPHGVDLDAVAAACALARHDESDQV